MRIEMCRALRKAPANGYPYNNKSYIYGTPIYKQKPNGELQCFINDIEVDIDTLQERLFFTDKNQYPLYEGDFISKDGKQYLITYDKENDTWFGVEQNNGRKAAPETIELNQKVTNEFNRTGDKHTSELIAEEQRQREIAELEEQKRQAIWEQGKEVLSIRSQAYAKYMLTEQLAQATQNFFFQLQDGGFYFAVKDEKQKEELTTMLLDVYHKLKSNFEDSLKEMKALVNDFYKKRNEVFKDVDVSNYISLEFLDENGVCQFFEELSGKNDPVIESIQVVSYENGEFDMFPAGA